MVPLPFLRVCFLGSSSDHNYGYRIPSTRFGMVLFYLHPAYAGNQGREIEKALGDGRAILSISNPYRSLISLYFLHDPNLNKDDDVASRVL